MTIQEFHINFDIELDKTQDFEYPAFIAEQKDYWLNKAQERVIEEIAYPKDSRELGFEQDQERVDQLRNLVKKSPLLIPSLNGDIYTVTLPTDYRHLVRHQCTATEVGSTCGSKTVGGEQVRHEYINQMLKDPFWWPTAEEPLYYFEGNNIVYETKGNYILNNVRLDYIKNARRMQLGSQYQVPTADIECELNPIVHERILDTAISMVLENIESQRYQTNLNELSKSQ